MPYRIHNKLDDTYLAGEYSRRKDVIGAIRSFYQDEGETEAEEPEQLTYLLDKYQLEMERVQNE